MASLNILKKFTALLMLFFTFHETGYGQILADSTCAANLVLEFETYSNTTISGNFGPGNYFFSGTITVNGFTTFTDAVVIMDQNATINVSPGFYLYLYGCHFLGCHDMWNGIVLQTSGSSYGTILLDKSQNHDATMIEDARAAVSVNGPASIASYAAIFNRNNVGIDIENSPSPNVHIRNSIFTSRKYIANQTTPSIWPSIALLKTASTTPFPYPYNYSLYVAPFVLNDDITYPPALCKDGSK